MKSYEELGNLVFGDRLEIEFDKSSDVPIWVQMTFIIAGQVSYRRIKVGEYIRSIREIARLNKISVKNMAKAYRVLVGKGILESTPRDGYRVGKNIKNQSEKLLLKQIRDLETSRRQLGR